MRERRYNKRMKFGSEGIVCAQKEQNNLGGSRVPWSNQIHFQFTHSLPSLPSNPFCFPIGPAMGGEGGVLSLGWPIGRIGMSNKTLALLALAGLPREIRGGGTGLPLPFLAFALPWRRICLAGEGNGMGLCGGMGGILSSSLNFGFSPILGGKMNGKTQARI